MVTKLNEIKTKKERPTFRKITDIFGRFLHKPKINVTLNKVQHGKIGRKIKDQISQS
jgi:hypothetical protein